MGYCRAPTLTTLGMLRAPGTEDVDRGVMPASGGEQIEGYEANPLSRAGRARLSRGGRAFGIAGRIRRSRATASARTASIRRRLEMSRVIAKGTPSRTRTTRRSGIGGMVSRMRERARTARARQQAADAERAASEALQIAEAERLARESVTGRPPPTVTDRDGWGRPRQPPPMVGTMQACVGSPPDRRRGWECFSGQWRYRSPFAPSDRPIPSLPERPPQNGAPWPPPGTEIEKAPTARPWWQARPVDGEIPMRDTSGIPTPPGLPGGPSMRPPASGPDDTATERVAPAPAAGPDMAKLLPLAAAAAFMFFK